MTRPHYNNKVDLGQIIDAEFGKPAPECTPHIYPSAGPDKPGRLAFLIL
ncbi:MAG: hypothetical protein QHH26_12885 [Armatimonadota bacterium]|nr:hypothetical protein [Armatimonadota bacterium]